MVDLVVDSENLHVVALRVKSNGLVQRFFSKELFIHRSQIVSVDEKKVIVVDSVVSQTQTEERETLDTLATEEEVAGVSSSCNTR